MQLAAPTTITLRRPSAESDLIISRHDDAVIGRRSSRTTCDLAERQVSYSDPGSASDSSLGGSQNSLLECSGRKARGKKRRRRKKSQGCMEERWRCGVRRASDCMRDVIKRFQQQLQLCNDNRSKVNDRHDNTQTFFRLQHPCVCDRCRLLTSIPWASFVVASGFISRSAHGRLQISVCSGYDLCHPGLHPDTRRHTQRQHCDQLI